MASAAESQPYLLNAGSITWIHLRGGASVDTLRELGRRLHLHRLVLEDVADKRLEPASRAG